MFANPNPDRCVHFEEPYGGVGILIYEKTESL